MICSVYFVTGESIYDSDQVMGCFLYSMYMLFQMEAYDVAIKSCESVLREEPQNTKALFRKGKVSVDTTVLSPCWLCTLVEE